MKTIMVIGASRGIGLESVKQFLAQGYQVIATCRNLATADQLQGLAKDHEQLRLEACDINNELSIHKLAKKLDVPIDILLINAGISSDRKALDNVTVEDFMTLFRTNAVGHFLVAKNLLPQVAKSHEKLMVSISSRMGSMSDNTSGTRYAYRASKAADNAIMKSLAHDVAELGVHVAIYHPGFVQTDMTKGRGDISVSEAVKRLRLVIDSAKQYDSGCFLNHDGSVIPW